MRILVLGGTAFLSHAVAAEAARRGHDVVCACRGASGAVPDGTVLARFDRTGESAPHLPDGWVPDAVVDVARTPSWVRSAVAAFSDAHWVLVSTVSVYADDATPGGGPGITALHAPVTTDEDPAGSPEIYGAMKVACEQLVTGGTRTSLVVRPGLVVGPGDPTGRFDYWPERLAEGGEVLAPGAPDDVVQVVDVRDLAAWIVSGAESRSTGVLDGVGPPMPFSDLLEQVAAGVGGPPAVLTWVDGAFLEQHGVEPWSGDRSLPLWLPRPAYDGMLAHDAGPAAAAGLVVRPLADTARDTLAWLRERPDSLRTGLARGTEQEVLAAWHARG